MTRLACHSLLCCALLLSSAACAHAVSEHLLATVSKKEQATKRARTQPTLSAQGVAVYGWKYDQPTAIILKNKDTLYPIASITKIATAKVVEDGYSLDKVFTINKKAAATYGHTPGIVAGSTFSRNDLLKALLINSCNDAATALYEPIGGDAFMDRINQFLHEQHFATTDFVNDSGLDPNARGHRATAAETNRLTPEGLTQLVHYIYNTDPLLTTIMAHPSVAITDRTRNRSIAIGTTNPLFSMPKYKNRILLSKTGTTRLAGENLVMVASSKKAAAVKMKSGIAQNDTASHAEYDYYTIVILHSQNRVADAQKIFAWIDR